MVVRLAILAGVALAVSSAIVLLRRYFEGGKLPERFDPADLGLKRPAPALVEFTSPFCHECKVALPLLRAASLVHKTHLAVIDAKVRPDLARKYGVRHTPTILVVDGAGAVRAGWTETPPETELEAALHSARNGRNGRRASRQVPAADAAKP